MDLLCSACGEECCATVGWGSILAARLMETGELNEPNLPTLLCSI